MSEFKMGVPMASAPEAKKVAKAKAKKLKRDTITVGCSVVGDPTIKAGAELTFKGVRPGIDGLQFVITTVRHTFAKNKYETSIDGELKV